MKKQKNKQIDLRGMVVAQYKMNDNADNSTVINEYGVDGTYIGANTEYRSVSGVINTALTFNGIYDYIDTNQTFSDIFKSNFTISFWKDITEDTYEPSRNIAFLGSEKFTTPSSALKLGINPSKVFFVDYLVDGEGEFVGFPCESFLNVGVHHIVCSVEKIVSATTDLNFRFFIDGVLVKEQLRDDTFVEMENYNSDQNLTIGRHTSGGQGSDYSNSFIDNVIIFSGVLSEEEVSFLYNKGKGTEELFSTSKIEHNFLKRIFNRFCRFFRNNKK